MVVIFLIIVVFLMCKNLNQYSQGVAYGAGMVLHEISSGIKSYLFLLSIFFKPIQLKKLSFFLADISHQIKGKKLIKIISIILLIILLTNI